MAHRSPQPHKEMIDMVDKVTRIEKAYELKNHLRKNKLDQRKKNKPKFTPPPNDAG